MIALERLTELQLGGRLALGGQAPPSGIELVEKRSERLGVFLTSAQAWMAI